MDRDSAGLGGEPAVFRPGAWVALRSLRERKTSCMPRLEAGCIPAHPETRARHPRPPPPARHHQSPTAAEYAGPAQGLCPPPGAGCQKHQIPPPAREPGCRTQIYSSGAYFASSKHQLAAPRATDPRSSQNGVCMPSRLGQGLWTTAAPITGHKASVANLLASFPGLAGQRPVSVEPWGLKELP